MKIVIIGGGIGGLVTYHALRKHLADTDPSISVKLVESHPSLSNTSRTIGGGLGLAPNGMRAIASVAPEAVAYINERGFLGDAMSFRNSNGRLLGRFKSGTIGRYGFGMLMIRRAVVHEALIPGLREEDVHWGMKVESVKEVGEQVLVEYEDGTTELADLVIGADGVRSVVQHSLFDGVYKATYDGLTGVGGFIPFSDLSPRLQESFDAHGVTMTFGRKGFFGYSLCVPASTPSPFIQWWSIYEAPSMPDREKPNKDAIKAQLLACHGSWKSPYDSPDSGVYKSIIELGCRDSETPQNPEMQAMLAFDMNVLVLPRYVTPRLPCWTNAESKNERAQGRIILLGDAAHTMPPDSGQGVSCAAEDAVVYALLLKHYYTAPDGLRKAAKAYERMRMPRVHRILDVAKRNGDAKKEMGWFAQKFRDTAVWLLCKLPESIHDYAFAYDSEKAVAEFLAKEKL